MSRIKVVAGGYVVGELVFTVRDGRLSVEFEPVNRVYYGGIKLYLASSVDGLIDAEEFNINEEINAETLIDENGALFLRIESNVMLDEEELERYDVFDPNSEEYQQMMEQMLQILK